MVYDMVPWENRKWEYRDADKNGRKENIEMMVPQLSGDAETVQRLKSKEVVENMGLFGRPCGCSNRHILQMRDMMEDCTKQVNNGMLPTWSVWKSCTHQLWSGL